MWVKIAIRTAVDRGRGAVASIMGTDPRIEPVYWCRPMLMCTTVSQSVLCTRSRILFNGSIGIPCIEPFMSGSSTAAPQDASSQPH